MGRRARSAALLSMSASVDSSPILLSFEVSLTRFVNSLFLPWFVSKVGWTVAPFPPPGRLEFAFPDFVGTMKQSDFPSPVRPHFVSFAWPYHVRNVNFVFRFLATTALSPRHCIFVPTKAVRFYNAGLPRPAIGYGDEGISQVSRKPLCTCSDL